MDHDHKLDAPNNDELNNIEQITSHSELSTLYPHTHLEWEGDELLSKQDRENKMDHEKLLITLTIRRWFLVIGTLVPFPPFVIIWLIFVGAKYLDIKSAGVLLLPVLFGVALVGVGTYFAYKYVLSIFYNHAIKGSPFVVLLLGFLAMSLPAIFEFSRPLHTGEYIIDTLIIGASAMLISIMLTGIFLMIWASQILSSKGKIWCIVATGGGILLATAALYAF